MDYYKKVRDLIKVDDNDKAVGRVERWEAHRQGVLHRGFTINIIVGGKIVLQHRKHPVFDGWFDLGCSSHPVFLKDKEQDTHQAVKETLKREWNLDDGSYSPIQHRGYVIYHSKDKYSEYKEHELCHLYQIQTNTILKPNYHYAYGFSLVSKEELAKTSPITKILAPWVIELERLL